MSKRLLSDVIDCTSEAVELVAQAVRRVELAQQACAPAGFGPEWTMLRDTKFDLQANARVLAGVIDRAKEREQGWS